VLWLTRRRDLRLSVCLRESSECKNVLSEITLLDKIFKVPVERLALRSSMFLVIMEGTIVSRFGASRVAHVCLRTLHPGLTCDGFEDSLGSGASALAIRYLVSSGLALLRMRERLLLESAMSASLEVNEGASVWRFGFVSSSPRWKDRLAKPFIASSNWIYGLARYRTSLQRMLFYFTRCLYSG